MAETAEQNDEQISKALLAKVEGDYLLAQALFENYTNGYYRLHGFRSVPEYLRERFKDQEQDSAARMHARSFQRLIREYKLAREIPEFREAFDLISRSNRRLIAQVITPENAIDWIEKAKKLKYRELEELISSTPGVEKDEITAIRRLRLYPGQLAVFEQAIELAGKLLEAEGSPAKGPEGQRVELIAAEFISTYGTTDGFKPHVACECPRCGKFVSLTRRPQDDLADGEHKALVLECSACHAVIVMKAVHGHDDQDQD